MNILPYSELNVNGLGKNRLLPIIDTLRKMGGRSGVFALKLGTLDDARAAFKKFREYAVYSTLGEARVLKALNTLNITTAADFKEFLLDQDYGRILLAEVPKMQIKLTGANNGKRGRVAGRQNTRTVRSMSEVYNIFGYTWDEEEALEKGDWNEKDVWVIRTNRQDLPTLFIYPKEKYEEDDIKEMISKYEHRLATLYKYELRDPSVNAYWLARPCTYRHWLKHPIPDGSERIDPDETDMNENNNIKYNMNTSLNRDRNTLKRLVESYGKKDVLDFVKHLNEEAAEDLPIFFHYNVVLRDELDKADIRYHNSSTKEDLLDDYSSTTDLKFALAETQDDDYEYDTIVVALHNINEFEELVDLFAQINCVSFDDALGEFESLLGGGHSDFCEVSKQNDPSDIYEMLEWVDQLS